MSLTKTAPVAAPQRERTPSARAVPVAPFDLLEEVRRMRATARQHAGGHTAKTLMRSPDLRLVLIALQPGAQIRDHRAEGRETVQVLDGRVRMRWPGGEMELGPGGLATVEPGVAHAFEALDDASVLVSIAWSGHR